MRPWQTACVRIFGILGVLVLGAGCASPSHPVLPGGGSPSGVSAGEGADVRVGGDTPADTQGDDSSVAGQACDLRTYIHTQQGCLPSEACYPVSGAGKCQIAGTLGAFGACAPGDATLACAGGLACVSTRDMGSVCLFLCDVAEPGCDLGNVCSPLGGMPGVGVCQVLP